MYVVEDIPHFLLSVLVILHGDSDSDSDGDSDGYWFARVRIAFSLSSVVCGILNKCYQKAAERDLERASLNEPLVPGAE